MTLPSISMKTAALRAAAFVFAAGLAGALAAPPAAARQSLVPLSPCTSFTDPPAGSIGSPALSSDASHVAFLHCYDPDGLNPLGLPQLFITGLDDSTARQVTSSSSIRNPRDPVFSVDGEHLYFTAEMSATGVRELFRAPVSGGDPERLTFQTTLTGFSATGRPSPLGSAGACFTSGSDLLGESLGLGSFNRNVYTVDAAGALRRLTSTDSNLVRNAWILAGSVDGRKLVYIAEDPSFSHSRPFRPLLLDVGTRLTVPLTPDVGAGMIEGSATPFQSRVVFTSAADYLAHAISSTPQVFRVGADGMNLEQLTEVQLSGALTAASDSSGTAVAFESTASVLFNETTGISRVYSEVGGRITRLSTGRSPNVSPGDARIAYVDDSDSLGGNSDHSLEIFSVRPDGSDRKQHSRFVTGISEAPDISTDGAWAVFTSTGDLAGRNPDGNREIFSVAVDGTHLKQLTDTKGNRDSREPSVSSDGTFIVFASNADLVPGMNVDGNYEIFRCGTDGSALLQVTQTTFGNSSLPSISATGDVIGFATTANVGGGGPMNLGRVAVWRQGGSIQLVTLSSDRQIEVLHMDDAGLRIAILTEGNIGGVNPSHWRRAFTVATTGGPVAAPVVPGAVEPGSLGMSPEGNWLATAALDGFLRLFPFGGGTVDTLFGAAGLLPAYPALASDARSIVFSVVGPSGDFVPGDSYVLERGQTAPVPLIGSATASASKQAAISGDGSRIALVMTGRDSLNPDGSTEVFSAGVGVTSVALQSFTAARVASGAVRITWVADTDADHLLFRLSRSESRDGPFRMIQDRITGRGPIYQFIDSGPPFMRAWYRLDAIDRSGKTQRFGPIEASDYEAPGELRVSVEKSGNGAYVFSLDVPYARRANLRLYDVAGRLVRTLMDDVVPAGKTAIRWDGRNERGTEVAFGAYFLKLDRQPARVLIVTR